MCMFDLLQGGFINIGYQCKLVPIYIFISSTCVICFGYLEATVATFGVASADIA